MSAVANRRAKAERGRLERELDAAKKEAARAHKFASELFVAEARMAAQMERTESIACGFAFAAGQQLGELQREVHRCWCDRGYSGSCGCSNRIGDLLYDFGPPKCWRESHEGPDGTIPWPCPECAAGDAP